MRATSFNTPRLTCRDMSDPPAVAIRIGEQLRESDETLATAESATGGLLSSLITDVPGSSDYFDRGFVTYAYEAKMGSLGVDRELLDDLGAVCEPVAVNMARAARDRAGTTWGVSITGIAGPGGGSVEKPVGTTFIGVASAAPWGSGRSLTTVNEYRFDGDRQEIKRNAAERALQDLEDRLTEAHGLNDSRNRSG